MAFENDQVISSTSPNVQSFVDTYKPVANSVGKELNVDPGILLGKWGNETSWGKSVVPDTYNLGNIKDFSGKGVEATDNVTKTKDRYKKYASPEEFGKDYANLIKTKYPKAVGAGSDVDKFTAGLTGYAEDPNYSTKVGNAYKQVGSFATEEKPTKQEDPFAKDKIVSQVKEDLFSKDKIVSSPQTETDPFANDKVISSPSLVEAVKSEFAEETQHPVDTFLSHMVAGIPGAMGGRAAGMGLRGLAIAAGPETGGLSVALPIISQFIGYGVGAYATTSVERNLLPDVINHHLDVGAEQNKYTAELGDIASFGTVEGFQIPKVLSHALVSSGIGMSIEGFSQWMKDEYDPLSIAIAGATWPFIGGKATKLGDLATLKPLRDVAPKQNVEDLLKQDIYTPKEFNDYKVVDLEKEEPKDYSERHNITEDKVDEHKQTSTNSEGPVRTVTSVKDGTPHIEVDKNAVMESFKAKEWKTLYNLPENHFKTPQAYTEFLLNRATIAEQIPFDNWKAQGDKATTDPELVQSPEQLFNEYNQEINKYALEASEVNPLFNLDLINIPDLPVNMDGLPNWLFTLKNRELINTLNNRTIHELTNLTDEQRNTLRHFVEGLHKDHVSLHSQALSLDEASAEIKRSINQETRRRDVQEGSPNWIKWDNIKKSKPPWEPKYGPLNWDRYSDLYVQKPYNLSWNEYIKSLNKSDAELVLDHMSYSQSWKDHIATLPEADQYFANRHRPFLREVALRLKSVEKNKVEAEKLRVTAKQRLEFTPEEKAIFDKVYKPLLQKRIDITKFLMKEGLMKTKTLSENNFPRKTIPMTKAKRQVYEDSLRAKGLLEPELEGWRKLYGSVKDFMEELGGGDMGGFNADLQKRRNATKDRSVFVLEGNDGKRSVIEVMPGGNIIKWENINGIKEPTLLTRLTSPTDGSRLTPSGSLDVGDKILNGIVVEGTMPEIEYHSPFKYNKDSLAVLLDSVSQLEEQARYYQGLKDLMASDMFKELAKPAGPKDEIPDGYSIPPHLDRLPILRGLAFPNNISQVISDFAQVRDPTLLTNLTSLIVKNMMLNPLGHMYNEGAHLFVGRGLTGWVTPTGIYRFVKYGKQAIDDVLGMSKFYTDTIKYGGTILGENTRMSTFEEGIYKKGLKEFSNTQEFKDLAKDTGKSLLNLYNELSNASSRAMWMTRNILYVQWLREVMGTKTHPDGTPFSHMDAIKYVEKHMPNYRIPTKIGENYLGSSVSRGLSNVMRNPNFTVFSPYHYGLVNSLMNTMKEVGSGLKGKAGREEFKDGLNRAAALAIGLAIIYPFMDMLAQRMTGNPDAHQRRAGPFHLIHALGEVADGTKDPQSVLSSLFTPNPALMGIVQFGFDRNFYTGQQIYNPMSEGSVITKDILRYFTQQVPQASQVFQATKDDSGEGAQVFGARQLDIESKTSTQQSKIDKMIRKLRKRALKHDIKREEDIL